MRLFCLLQLILQIRCSATTSIPVNVSSHSSFGNAMVNSLIIYGKDTNDHDHPFLALLLKRGALKCGGSVVSTHHVLTAAHCVTGSKPRHFMVVLGAHNRIFLNSGHEMKLAVKKIKVHEHFKKHSTGQFDNDIALLKLNETITFTPYIQPVRLPTTDTVNYQQATVYGWGVTEDGVTSVRPKQATLTLLTTQQCLASGVGHILGDPNTHICAQNILSDACQGDSGGPLLVKLSGCCDILIGIVSSGVGCDMINYPGIYTRVRPFRSWIVLNTRTSFY